MSKQIHERLSQLQQLELELHEANQELAEATRPNARLSDMSDEERHQLADQIRAKLARWDALTQQLSRVLGRGGNGIE